MRENTRATRGDRRMKMNGEGGVLRVVAIRGFSVPSPSSPDLPHKTAEAHRAHRAAASSSSSLPHSALARLFPSRSRRRAAGRRQLRPPLVFLTAAPSVPGSSAINSSANPIPLGLATILGVAWHDACRALIGAAARSQFLVHRSTATSGEVGRKEGLIHFLSSPPLRRRRGRQRRGRRRLPSRPLHPGCFHSANRPVAPSSSTPPTTISRRSTIGDFYSSMKNLHPFCLMDDLFGWVRQLSKLMCT